MATVRRRLFDAGRQRGGNRSPHVLDPGPLAKRRMDDRVNDSADAAFFETGRAGHDRRSQVEGSQAHCFALDLGSAQGAQPAQARCRERTQDAAPVGRDDDHLGLLAEQIADGHRDDGASKPECRPAVDLVHIHPDRGRGALRVPQAGGLRQPEDLPQAAGD